MAVQRIRYYTTIQLSQFNTFKEMSKEANITPDQLLDKDATPLVLDNSSASESPQRSGANISRLRQLGFNTLNPFIFKIMIFVVLT